MTATSQPETISQLYAEWFENAKAIAATGPNQTPDHLMERMFQLEDKLTETPSKTVGDIINKLEIATFPHIMRSENRLAECAINELKKLAISAEPPEIDEIVRHFADGNEEYADTILPENLPSIYQVALATIGGIDQRLEPNQDPQEQRRIIRLAIRLSKIMRDSAQAARDIAAEAKGPA